ncbi:MAG: ISL3 family transposase [Succinivibrio sp.]
MNSTNSLPLDQYIPVNYSKGMLAVPTFVERFKQTHVKVSSILRNEGTLQKALIRNHFVFDFYGHIDSPVIEEIRICPHCGSIMHRNGQVVTCLKHTPFGSTYTSISVTRSRYRCSKEGCDYSFAEEIPFKADGHLITLELKEYVETELSLGKTLKAVSIATGLHKSVVKDIDKARLMKKYTTVDKEGKRKLIKPERQATVLGIDEFKLHDGHKYATLIVDMKTGHILWIQAGKKKQVVYDFIEHVGEEFMSKVEAVSADMNSDFQEAFLEKCPHIKIVYDPFHIVKNFNDKVITNVRKDEQQRLIDSGDIEAAKMLKGSKYILMSSKSTLEQKDQDAYEGKVVSKGSELFKKQEVKQQGNQLARYQKLISENKLLFTCDYIKETLNTAYCLSSRSAMNIVIQDIIKQCLATENKHFVWFAKLLENHLDGILNHADYKISNGKVEGINQKIKTIRRNSYGLPDDEYFFLKLFDLSRNSAYS